MDGNALEFPPVRFSTSAFPERERLSRWREEFGRSLLRVDIEPMSSLPFHAKGKLRACCGSPTRFTRTQAMAAEGDDSIGLVINLGKRATASQRGREVALLPGDAVPILTQEPAILIT